jgi:hypothetical protein
MTGTIGTTKIRCFARSTAPLPKNGEVNITKNHLLIGFS